jgi:hypothetical protein
LPPQLLKVLATRNFNNAQQIETVLQGQASIAASRAKDIFETINKAREAFKSAQMTPAQPTTAASGIHTIFESLEGSSNPVTTTIVDDVWADFTSTAPSADIAAAAANTSKPTPKSSLFGSTFSKKVSSPAPIPSTSRPKGKSSGLFGKTISKPKEPSPSYEDVSSRIFRDLVPAKRSVVEEPPVETAASATEASSLATSISTQVPIPQQAGSAFDQTAPIVESSSDLPEPSPPKRPKTEEVVQVKKSSKSKAGAAKSGSTSSSGWGMQGHKEGKDKARESKTKKRTAEVPEFDYSTAPNLLDNPRSGIKDQGKKKKKEKKERKGMSSHFLSLRKRLMVDFSGADFGPAPKEKSNMRAGNKSGQF